MVRVDVPIHRVTGQKVLKWVDWPFQRNEGVRAVCAWVVQIVEKGLMCKRRTLVETRFLKNPAPRDEGGRPGLL